MNLEDTLKETFGSRLDSLELSGGDVAAARRTGRRMRVRRRVAAGTAAAAVVAVGFAGSLVAHDQRADGPSAPVGQWRELPTPPLSPRANAQAVWTGSEVIVVGGETNPCPPNADCASTEDGLRDGAAYNPRTDTWRRIARAPVPVGPGDRLLSAAGRVVLRHRQQHGSRLFVYVPDTDEWFEIPSFFADLPSAYGDDVYGLANDRAHHGRVVMYDARAGVWNERIPRDPMRPRLTERRVTATPSGFVVTGVPANIPRDGSVAPVVWADVWNGTRWTRGPETGQIGNNAWFWTGTHMVDPEPGTLDGGEVDNWGHAYPVGGVISVEGGWSRLPDGFTDDAQGGWHVDASGGQWVATYGQVFDTETGRVWTLPSPDGAPDLLGTTAVWAGDSLVAFGGVAFGSDVPSGTVTNHAWIYTP